MIGMTINSDFAEPFDPRNPNDVEAVDTYVAFQYGWFADPLVFGHYPEIMEEYITGGMEFDIPYRDLGFNGVPHRSNVFMQPTVNCLVHLSEQPFFIITLSEVEVAYFERVQFSLKNFDIVFIFKDYSKQVVHISTIPIDSLETIKEWLDSCNIKYYEGTQSLNWNRIMAQIQADPKKFHTEEGGWTFLSPDNGEANQSDSEPESDYSGESEASVDDEDDSDVVDEEGSDSEDGYSEEEDDSGEDWDELEEKARREDAEKANERTKRGRAFSDDEGSGREDKKKQKRPQGPPKKR